MLSNIFIQFLLFGVQLVFSFVLEGLFGGALGLT